MLPNVVLFAGKDLTSTASLWVTDGTASGTFELLTNPPADVTKPPITGEAIFGFVPQASMPLYLTVFDDQVLFWGRYSPNPAAPVSKGPYTLWTTDGTATGTVPIPLTSITGANPNGLFVGNDNSADVTPGFTVFGDQVLFRGIDTAGASGLWMTNGTASGTMEITAGAASGGINPTDITVFNGAALFNGVNAAGKLGLWTTDGTAEGTKEVTSTGGSAGLNPTDMTVRNNEVLFNGVDSNGVSGLWVTNGAAEGTQEVTVAGAAASGLDPTDMTVFGDQVLFNGIDANGLSGLWMTDGTTNGTRELLAAAAVPVGAGDPHGLNPTDMTVFNGKVIFNGLDSAGRQFLWVTNGAPGGTKEIPVTTGFPPSAGLKPSNLEVYNGQVLFSGLDSAGHQDLWTTDGTGTGTHEITPVSGVWSVGLFPTGLTALTVQSSPPPPPPTGAHDILFQNASGQVAGWEVDGASLTGSALLGANPGPSWKAVGGGDFNGDSEPDILLHNTNGNVAVWETDGTNVTTTAAVANPGSNWKAIGTGDFDGDPFSDILLQNTNGNVAIWEMSGTDLTRSAVVTNPGAQLEGGRDRRLRRQPFRHCAAEHERQRRHLGDGRDQRDPRDEQRGRDQSRGELESDRNRRLQRRRRFRHPVAEHERRRRHMGNERNQSHGQRRGGQSGAELARDRDGRRRRHPSPEHERPNRNLGHERDQRDRERDGQRQRRAKLACDRDELTERVQRRLGFHRRSRRGGQEGHGFGFEPGSSVRAKRCNPGDEGPERIAALFDGIAFVALRRKTIVMTRSQFLSGRRFAAVAPTSGTRAR